MKLKEDLNKEEFAKLLIPFLDERFNFYSMTKEDLIGKQLFSIEEGFGRMYNIMTVESVDHHGIHLVDKDNDHYGIEWDNRHYKLLDYSPELYKKYKSFRYRY